ncbi:MAG: TldD/PmbA family protein, partial [Oscillospiraceae bacterium]|nr:TldD/PmbA family protein [Oscillospiraceae bacterium]
MIARDICQRVLRKAVSTGADYAEIFAENTVNHNINMIASKVDSIKDTVIAGAAVRVYKGMRSVMASTVDTSEEGLLRCAETAAEALGQGTAQIDIVLKERIFGDIHPVKICPASVSNKEKVEILKAGYFAAKEYDPCVVQVSGGLADVDHNILIANTEGLYAQDRQIRTRIAISAVADKGQGTQTGSCSPGRRMGLEMFDIVDPKAVGIKAAQQAATMAGAGYCPAGVMPVAIDNGFGGVIFHEACGHSLEASSVAYGRSQ